MLKTKNSVGVALAGFIFLTASSSQAIPVRLAAPQPSVMAHKIIYPEVGMRERIRQGLHSRSQLMRLQAFGIDRSEVDSVLSILSNRDLYTLQKVFMVSFEEREGHEEGFVRF